MKSTLLALLMSVTGSSPPLFTLDEAIERARNNSNTLKSNAATAKSAALVAEAFNATRYPKLSLDGSFRAQTVVPEATFGGNSIKLNDYYGYSVGPTITYTLWDSGAKRNQLASLQALAHAKEHQSTLTAAQIALATKVTYIQAALTRESVDLAKHAAQLSQTQNKDIQIRLKNGSISRLDALNSDSEVLNYQLKIEQAQSEYQSVRADLGYLLGNPQEIHDNLENLADIIARHKNKEQPALSPSHPLIQIQAQLEKSALSQVNVQKAGYWPTLNMQLRSSADYPNGPIFKTIYQNSLGLNLSWSLFEFGSTKKQIAAKMADAQAAEFLKEETKIALFRDYEKAKARAQSFHEQIREAEKLVSKQEEISRLNYDTYRFGKLSYFEVQTSNIRLLDAKNRLALLRAQYLIQLSNIEYLAERNDG